MSRALLSLACLALLAPAALAGCGTSGDGGGGGEKGDAGEITAVIAAALMRTDPDDCARVAKMGFHEQMTKRDGRAAIRGCEQVAREGTVDIDSVEVEGLEVEAGKATAEATIHGGPFDDQTLEVAVTEEDGEWRVVGLLGFVDFEREVMLRNFKRTVRGEDALARSFVACFEAHLDAASDGELRGTLLDPDVEFLAESARRCED